MRLLKKMLKQKAVYWAVARIDEAGEVIPALPVDIKCRWEDDLEQGLDLSGTETTFMSTVYTDRDVDEGGYLMLGELQNLKGPLPPKEAHRIRKFSKLPTLNAKQFLRTVKL